MPSEITVTGIGLRSEIPPMGREVIQVVEQAGAWVSALIRDLASLAIASRVFFGDLAQLQEIGWDRLRATVEEAEKLARPEAFDPLELLGCSVPAPQTPKARLI